MGEITEKIEKVKFFQNFVKKSFDKILIKRIKSIHLQIERINNPDINDDYPYPKIIDNNQSLKHKVLKPGFKSELRSFLTTFNKKD